jgi:putative endopeptidase
MNVRRVAVALCLGLLAAVSLLLVFSVHRSVHASADTSNWGFSLSNLDKTCKPCDDFFEYAMGGWMKNNAIPPEYPQWGSFMQLRDKNLSSMRSILDAATKANAAAGSNDQKIGDFYFSCMDTSAIDAAKLKPLQPELAKIDAIQDQKELQAAMTRLHRITVNTGFEFGSTPDFKDSTKMIAEADQGGLGLPDRDYYLRDDDHSKKLREGYVLHIEKIFELAGDTPDHAAAQAKIIMTLETALAKASRTNVELRDPEKNYNKMTLAQMTALTPTWSWPNYLGGIGAPQVTEANVGQPEFFKEFDHQLTATSIQDWKSYLKWHLLHSAAPFLSQDFVDENFNFYGKQLAGTKELPPRWKRCVQTTDRFLGEALGEAYVRTYFTPEAKAHAKVMVNNLIDALRSDIPTLTWMGPETKKQAIAKLEAFTVKIGYPDKWRDYSSLTVDRGSYLANAQRGAQFLETRDLNKIGKPIDRTEWGMTPPTVNAYYNPTFNEIVFPAGILQPPFYDPKADDAVNYGGMGAVIGHEISHGFDDQGSKFDGQGNLKEWWTADDRKNFNEHAACVSTQFDGYEVEPGLHQNGKLVLGESIGDLGGITIAYAAYEKSIQGNRPKDIDGFTPEQRFFLGWAQVWGANLRPEYARLLTNTNPHPLPKFRGNGPLSNMPQFAQAWGCKKGDTMVRDQTCKIW